MNVDPLLIRHRREREDPQAKGCSHGTTGRSCAVNSNNSSVRYLQQLEDMRKGRSKAFGTGNTTKPHEGQGASVFGAPSVLIR
jgi:hypothetical protein